MISQQLKASSRSENLWSAIVLILTAVFVGFPTEAGLGAEQLFVGILATAKAVVTWIKSGVKTKPAILEDTNFWNYLAAAAVAIIPGLPAELFTQAEVVVRNLISGEWQAAIIAGFSLLTIIIKVLRNKKEPELPLPVGV